MKKATRKHNHSRKFVENKSQAHNIPVHIVKAMKERFEHEKG